MSSGLRGEYCLLESVLLLWACRMLGFDIIKVAQPNAINTEPTTTQMKGGFV